MREIRPIGDLGNRVQVAGRIRMGIKTGPKAQPKALDTWRFTSAHHDCLLQLASMYGGEVKAWDDPKAAVRNQYEVVTTSKAVRVYIPPGGLSQHYEHWSGSRCERRCDGETAEIPSRGPDGTQEVPCQCTQEEQMVCKPHTRISVVPANVTFRGVWRLDSKSWNAAEEMPAMEAMIDGLQETRDIVEAELVIESRSQMTAGGKRNFVVPVINLIDTAEALAAGESGIRPAIGAAPIEAPALTTGEVSSPDDTEPARFADALGPDHDDEVAEAEILYEPAEVKVEVTLVANDLIMEPEAFGRGVAKGVSEGRTIEIDNLTEEERTKAMDFMADVRSDRIEVTGVGDHGRLRIKRKGSR